MPYYLNILKDKNYNYGVHYFPHDIVVKEFGTGVTREEILQQNRLNYRKVPNISIQDGIEAVRQLLPFCYFDAEHCEKGINALKNYKREWDDKLGTYKKDPLHDWSSHASDAFRYLAVSDFKDVLEYKPYIPSPVDYNSM